VVAYLPPVHLLLVGGHLCTICGVRSTRMGRHAYLSGLFRMRGSVLLVLFSLNRIV